MEFGVVKHFFEKKGYGFIRQEGEKEDIFFHHTEIKMEGYRVLNEGQRVQFSPQRRDKGLVAVDVHPVEDDGKVRCHACGQEIQT